MFKKGYLILIWIIGCYACSHEQFRQGDFISVYKQSQQEGKYLWMILGGGENCVPCNTTTENIQKSGILSEYKDRVIFYKCNTNDSTHRFLHYTFLMEAVPNAYIINPAGEVVYFHFGTQSGEETALTLDSILSNQPVHSSKHHQFYSENKQLLEMQNLLLQASISLNNNTLDTTELSSALQLIQKSIHIEPCFYNLYLLYEVQKQSGDTSLADSCATNALGYYQNGYQGIVYEKLANELKSISSTYLQSKDSMPVIEFQNHEINCGELAYNTHQTIRIEFQNTGQQPLIIANVSSSCGCAKPEWNKKPVFPGEKGEISIDYHASGKGAFNRSIVVQSNASNSIKKLTLRGEVK